MTISAKVPRKLLKNFTRDEIALNKIFKNKNFRPPKGTLEIFGERYLLVRAASLSIDFFDCVVELYKKDGVKIAGTAARQLLFDLGHAIGIKDAEFFQKKMKLTDPMDIFAVGPIHFAYTGWAFVHIFKDSNIVDNKNFFLLYDHPYSFEADSWQRAKRKSDVPVCHMNMGYSSGWCEHSFGMPLVATEILCKAKGDAVCRFIMAHPDKIQSFIKMYLAKGTKFAKKIKHYRIPEFFQLQKMKEQVAKVNTKLKKYNRDLQKSLKKQATIMQELQKQRSQLEIEKEKADTANYAKTIFLANMSHELRTPLNAIIGFAELLHSGKISQSSAENKEYLQDILSSSRHLLQIINDILDISKVDAGKMDFNPELIDIRLLVNDVNKVLRNIVAKKHIRMEVMIDEGLDHIVIDPVKLKQVLYNYISNAIKFSHNRGKIVIHIYPEGKHKFVLAVIDHGIGIREQDIAKLFVEFQQLDGSIAKKYPGTGLGLVLTKRIVETQGGSVGVKSVYGKGSTFYAVLPLNAQ